jgi:hypothetical protein
MSYLTEPARRRLWVPPWYVWCAFAGVMIGLAQVVLGRPWESLIWPLAGIGVAVGGWIYAPRRLPLRRGLRHPR